jgi:hypothetical protein
VHIVSLEANFILSAIAIGIGATLLMDLWNLFLKRAFSIPSLNYCLLTEAPPNPLERMVGRIAHYQLQHRHVSSRQSSPPATVDISGYVDPRMHQCEAEPEGPHAHED